MQVKAVIFDWAGTLVDFGSIAPVISIRRAFEASGVDVTEEEVREAMGLPKAEHILQIACGERVAAAWLNKHGAPFGKDDLDRVYEEFRTTSRRVASERGKLIPGVQAAVKALREREILIGTTTGYSRDIMEPVISVAGAQGFEPDIVVCSDDAPHGRPTPLAIYQVMVSLGVFPASAIIKVDDTPAGLMEGKAAGTWAVGVSETGSGVGLEEHELSNIAPEHREERVQNAAKPLLDAGADYVVGSVAEILEVLDDINERLSEGERPELVEYETAAA
jgi:phosphonoacetaldehyde hydrolase